MVVSSSSVTSSTELSVKTQRVYDFRSGLSEPKFLDKVDVDRHLMIPSSSTSTKQEQEQFQTLDETHLNGRVHTGVWVHVIDSTYVHSNTHRLLLLKRGPQLVTCPSSWGLVGEHTNYFEQPSETTFRAIVEEIFGGGTVLNMVHPRSGNDGGGLLRNQVNYYEGTNVSADDAENKPNMIIDVAIDQLSDHPFYYLRDYGDEENNDKNKRGSDERRPSSTRQKKERRIDRQVTWLMKAQLFCGRSIDSTSTNRSSTDYKIDITKLLKFDDEVSDHVWVTLQEYEIMLYGNNHTAGSGAGDKGGNVDDNLESSIFHKFCHPTIVKLARLGLRLLKDDLGSD
jgi:hypothetical protein